MNYKTWIADFRKKLLERRCLIGADTLNNRTNFSDLEIAFKAGQSISNDQIKLLLDKIDYLENKISKVKVDTVCEVKKRGRPRKVIS